MIEILSHPAGRSGPEFWLVHGMGVFAFIALGYSLSRVLRRNDIADSLWGLGFLALATLQLPSLWPEGWIQIMSFCLLGIWSLRLSIYLSLRNLAKAEDIRYRNWRKEWGKTEPQMAFLKVFLLQGLILGLVSLGPVWVIASEARMVEPLDFAGLTLILIGLLFEWSADGQLSQYKKTGPAKGILDSGVWSLSRHPNYFGECLIALGFALIAIGSGGAITLLTAALMIFLLTKVSGVTLLEKLMKKKGAAFSKYVKTVPALVPFGKRSTIGWVVTVATLIVLDPLWLGGVMKDFYLEQTRLHTVIIDGAWQVVLWPVIGVYFFLGTGVYYFAAREESAWLSFFKGGLLGLCMYGLYEMTNLALVDRWPVEMAWVDLIWGVFLCASAAATGQVARSRLKQS
jgi:steroid 5-alpha reductase family enzyme